MGSNWQRFSRFTIVPLVVTLAFTHPTIRSTEHHAFPPANSTSSSVQWSACPAQARLPPNMECASFSVPIDWEQPYGNHFELGLVRMPARSNSSSKIGSLFVNPGGPGGRASDIVAGIAAGAVAIGPLGDSFDIVGLDPRGVGLSSQIKCDMSIFAERVSLFPQTQEDLDKLVDKNKRLGKSCRQFSGPLLEHIDTVSVVKDHEAVRVALGNEPFNFLGMSYGSQLGAQYAALFPDNIRTLALDGILGHSPPEIKNLLVETTTYEMGLSRFFDWANSSEDSVLKGQDVKALWTRIIARATTAPIPAAACNGTTCLADVTAEEIQFNSHRFLTFAGAPTGFGASWAQLSSALYNASQGDASTLSTQFGDPAPISFLGIGCLDWSRATDLLSSSLATQAMLSIYAPNTHGATSMWNLQYGCLGWPFLVKNPPSRVNVWTDATVLIVQSTADPVTGMPWALGLADEVHNHALVLREGDGHTSFPLTGETFEVIVDYLISGKAPKAVTFTKS